MSLLVVPFMMTFVCVSSAKSTNEVKTISCEFGRSQPHDITLHLKTSGYITSANLPAAYTAQTNQCLLNLKACNNCYIDFGFDSFSFAECREDKSSNNTGGERGCSEDNRCSYLLMKDGNKTTAIFSGSQTGQVFVSRHNTVKLLFCSSKTEIKNPWKISFTVRESGVKGSCYYSVKLRHTCPDGTCSDSLGYCAMRASLYTTTPKQDIPGHVIVAIIGTITFFSLLTILAVTGSGSILRIYKYIKWRLQTPEYVREPSIEISLQDSDVESDDSDDLNSQGRDTLSPTSRSELPSMGLKYENGPSCNFLPPWRHY